jgi:hypothetical protein
VPHHLGNIDVRLEAKEQAVQCEIHLPEGLEGKFIWQGKIHSLHGGSQQFNLGR